MIRGLALGMESAAVPVLVIGLAMYVATDTIGFYGVGLAGMSGMGEETRAITNDEFGPSRWTISDAVRGEQQPNSARMPT